jgi:anti-sigma regulatory factor (Ser/Thr protein kinase)
MRPPGLRHQARLYAGEQDFVPLALDFLAPAVAAGAPVLVAADADKCERLRAQLDGADSAGPPAMTYTDMAVAGHNPALLLSLWRSFAEAHADHPCVWGISEPVWPGRTAEEQVECRHHEAHLNLGFRDGPELQLLCMYDTEALPRQVLAAAAQTHPRIGQGAAPAQPSLEYHTPEPRALLSEALPPPERVAVEVPFGPDDLRGLRAHVEHLATDLGLEGGRTADLVLAVDEAATNTARHAGGRGVFSGWLDGRAIVCEIRDRGRITDPLVGRQPPSPWQYGGRGLWIINQLCDLVQVRSSDRGTVVRLHMRFGGPRVRPRP